PNGPERGAGFGRFVRRWVSAAGGRRVGPARPAARAGAARLPACPTEPRPMLEPEALQAAVLAASGELQALMNQLGLASRSAPTAKLVFDSDLRASLRRSLQFGRSEFVAVDAPLGKSGVLAR